MLSIIIPSRNEKYLEKTIDDVLEHAEGEIEVLVMLDGYRPDPEIPGKPGVSYHYFENPVGQRACVNWGARLAKGEYIMKLDAHCSMGQGFDVILSEECDYYWTVIPRMYNLDVEKWKPKYFENTQLAIKRGKLNDYMFLGLNSKGELRTHYYPRNIRDDLHNNDRLIDDTMSCQGCCFFMHKI